MSWPSVEESGFRSRASLNSSSASLCRPRMLLGRAEAGALERGPVVRIVGLGLERLRIFENGLVVALPPLRLFAGPERGRGRASRERDGEKDRGQLHPVTTSTSFGTSK